jgi:energy-coupling factor transporter ATP-binding protein EcfA2
MKGTVIIDDADTKKIRAAQLAGRVGMAFEDAEAQFIFPTVEDDIAFALESLGLTQQEVRYRLERVLREFGLEDLRSQAAGELSGGQKQRASIAGLLAVQPKILLLDEPTAELDPAGKEGIVNIIRRIRSESDMTIVIVEQDLEEIAAFVDRFLLLDDGKIQRDSKPSDFFAEPDELLKHGVNPPEVCIIFASLKKSGILHSIPLTVSEAIEIIKSNR